MRFVNCQTPEHVCAFVCSSLVCDSKNTVASFSGKYRLMRGERLKARVDACLTHMHDMPHAYVWHDSFVCARGLRQEERSTARVSEG